MRVLSFDDFTRHVLAELSIDSAVPLGPETTIVEDLGLDSVALVEALAVIEDLGSVVDERALETTLTLADLHHLYVVGRVEPDLLPRVHTDRWRATS